MAAIYVCKTPIFNAVTPFVYKVLEPCFYPLNRCVFIAKG